MKLVTWNINSVRLRIRHVKTLTEEIQPDVLCLQETKSPDDKFPMDDIKAMGYEHIHINGMKSYNGQAILSKIPFETTDIFSRVGREDCRHISATIKGAEIHNLYIPAGGDEPNIDTNEKFVHKLAFVDEMTQWFADRYSTSTPLIAVGDFNIAPGEHDVWSHKQLLKIISHTPPETDRLAKMKSSLNWTDAIRHFVPEDEKCYSWWSYRNRDWKKSNRGRRLDHIWVTEPLKSKLTGHNILTHARDWEKPSDHVPVVVELDL